jgi:hypothetical protein
MRPIRTEWTIYKSLWQAAESEGAFVSYTDREFGLEGGYFHLFDGRPHITLFRPFFKVVDKPTLGRAPRAPRDMPPPDIVSELFILAHELGHMASWGEDPQRSMRHWRALQGLQMRMMAGTVAPRRSDVRLLEEETRAWELAERILEREGYEPSSTFKAFRHQALEKYQSALGRRPRRL